jgi:hypothetical protein
VRAEAAASPASLHAPSGLADAAFAALMRAQSPAELAEAVRDHPALLEPWADDEVGARVDAALDEGNDRLAGAIVERLDALAQLRAELTAGGALAGAIHELVRAGEDEDAIALAISGHPVLLTDAGQEALFRLAAEARARGDDTLAERAVEYRAMLRTVRDGLEDPT